MATRLKQLTLDAPYNKISKQLWQKKKQNLLIQKQNMQLHTKIQKIKGKPLNLQTNLIYTKLKSKFQKLTNQYKQQQKWIKQINHTIQERNYEELMIDVHKIQSTLTRLTEKLLNQEKVYRKINKKVQKIQEKNKMPKGNITKHAQYLFQLELKKQELMQTFVNKSEKLEFIENNNRLMNKQIIELLKIKRQLKNHSAVFVDQPNKQDLFHRSLKNKEVVIDQIEMEYPDKQVQ